MKKILILLALLVPAAALAGGIGTHNLDKETKTKTVCYDNVPVPVTTDGSPNVTVGQDGVIFAAVISASNKSPSATCCDGTSTSTIPTFSPPAKLKIDLIDGNSDDTITCTSVRIKGRNQFGETVDETIASLTETATNTGHVYAEVTSIAFTDCDGGTDATDYAHVGVSKVIGLPYKARNYKDVVNVCVDDGTNTDCMINYGNSDGDDIESALVIGIPTVGSPKDFAIDLALTGPFNGDDLDDRDNLCITMRPRFTSGAR